jgi:hypothetical protein
LGTVSTQGSKGAAVDKKTLNLEEMKLKIRTGVKCGPKYYPLYGVVPLYGIDV